MRAYIETFYIMMEGKVSKDFICHICETKGSNNLNKAGDWLIEHRENIMVLEQRWRERHTKRNNASKCV